MGLAVGRRDDETERERRARAKRARPRSATRERGGWREGTEQAHCVCAGMLFCSTAGRSAARVAATRVSLCACAGDVGASGGERRRESCVGGPEIPGPRDCVPRARVSCRARSSARTNASPETASGGRARGGGRGCGGAGGASRRAVYHENIFDRNSSARHITVILLLDHAKCARAYSCTSTTR